MCLCVYVCAAGGELSGKMEIRRTSHALRVHCQILGSMYILLHYVNTCHMITTGQPHLFQHTANAISSLSLTISLPLPLSPSCCLVSLCKYADVTAKAKDGHTARSLALKNNHLKTVSFLDEVQMLYMDRTRPSRSTTCECFYTCWYWFTVDCG